MLRQITFLLGVPDDGLGDEAMSGHRERRVRIGYLFR